jgi:hypothetical protein
MFCALSSAVMLSWKGNFRLCGVWLLQAVKWTEKKLMFTLQNSIDFGEIWLYHLSLP